MIGIAKFAFFTTSVSYVFHLLNFPLICENKSLAGLTLTYDGFVYIILSTVMHWFQLEDCIWGKIGLKIVSNKLHLVS